MKLNSQATKGFTLIEILVSLTLLGFIFILLFSSLFTANKSWIAGEKKITNNEEVRLVTQFLRKQISQALPITWSNGKKNQLLFDGQESSLTFVSTLPSHRGGGGLNLIKIDIEQEDEASNLVINYQTVSIDSYSDTEIDINKSHLVSNIEHIEFNYYGSKELKSSPEWHNEWSDNENLPKLIRVTLHSSYPSIIWPQFDVPLPVDFIQGQPQFIIKSEEESPLT